MEESLDDRPQSDRVIISSLTIALALAGWLACASFAQATAQNADTTASDRFPHVELVGGTDSLVDSLAHFAVTDSVREFAEALIEEARSRGGRPGEALVLSKLAAAVDALGYPELAADYLLRAQELGRSLEREDLAIRAALSLAAIESRLGNNEQAEAVLDQAIARSQEQGLHELAATALTDLGILRAAEGKHRQASTQLRRAASLARRHDLPEVEMRALLAHARSLRASDGPEAALALLGRRPERLRGQMGATSRIELDSERGALLTDLGRYEECLAALRTADQQAESAGLDLLRLDTLTLGATCHGALGHPDSALDHLRQAAEIWEATQKRALDPRWRERRAVRGREIVTSLISLLIDAPRVGTPPERSREAFDIAQRFKKRTAIEELLGPAFAVVSDTTAITLGELQDEGLLADRELLLDSYLAPAISVLFAVTRDTCVALRLPGVDGELGAEIDRLEAVLARIPGDQESGATSTEIDSSLANLGRILLGGVGDLLDQCERVVFAPQGRLALVPIGALVNAHESPPDSALPGKEVLTVPSATILAELRRHAGWHREAPRRVLALVTVARRNGLPAGILPRAMESMALLYEGIEVRLADGTEAPVSTEELRDYDVVHLASHAELDDRHPWRTGLLIGAAAAGESAGAEETALHRLRASEIAALDLKARLAIISARESAPLSERNRSGEGMLAIASACLNAGVPAVVSSLWPVSDRAWASLIEELYGGLARGQTVAETLRQAALALREDPRTSDPHHWAGFVLVGDGGIRIDLAERPRPRSALRQTIVILVFVLIAAWIWSRRSAARRPA